MKLWRIVSGVGGLEGGSHAYYIESPEKPGVEPEAVPGWGISEITITLVGDFVPQMEDWERLWNLRREGYWFRYPCHRKFLRTAHRGNWSWDYAPWEGPIPPPAERWAYTSISLFSGFEELASLQFHVHQGLVWCMKEEWEKFLSECD